jgi:hypothetical protein
VLPRSPPELSAVVPLESIFMAPVSDFIALESIFIEPESIPLVSAPPAGGWAVMTGAAVSAVGGAFFV